MCRHPYFQLWLHDDEELSGFLGAEVVERVTLHDWPLSSVERLRLATGATFIYKTQSSPTVEPIFYNSARSPVLVSAKTLDIPGEPAALVLDAVEQSTTTFGRESESALLSFVDMVLLQISNIEGSLPATADLRSEEHWLTYADEMLSRLASLMDTGTFPTG